MARCLIAIVLASMLMILGILGVGAWFEAQAKVGLGLGLTTGAGSVTVTGPVSPPASTFVFIDTGGTAFKDTGGITFKDY